MNFKSIIDKSIGIWTILNAREKLISSLLIGFSIFVVILYFYGNQESKNLNIQKNRYKEFTILSEQYRDLSSNINNFEKREGLTKTKGLLEFVQNQFDELGIKKRIKSLKGLPNRDIKDFYLEESVDIVAENMTMNEIANLLFKLERAPMMISIKTLNIKKSFENPERLNIQITLSQFKKK
ncbi:MAG: hypothetical protein N2738_03985 [Thermodesulfovibrionales bacterium]|nr:hypothetical protein [Thermodesulfovibrionales bacterium]